MSLNTAQTHCEETDLNAIRDEIKRELTKRQYIVKNLEETPQKQTLRVRKGISVWNVLVEQQLERTGNFIITSIFRLDPRFQIFQKSSDQKKRTETSQNNSIWRMLWRWRWIAFIFMTIGAVVISFIPRVNGSLTYIGYVLLGIVGVIFVFYLAQYGYRSVKTPREFAGAEELSNLLKEIISGIKKENDEQPLFCWKCFREIAKDSKVCPYCNVSITKL